jgi:hypothetical protein
MKHRKIFGILALSALLSLVFVALPAEPALAQTITLSSTRGEVGSMLSISGSGFTPGVAFRLHFAYGTSYELVRSGIVPAGGTILDSFNIPQVPSASYTVFVETSATNFASGTFTIVPAIRLNKTSAYVGGEVTVSGTGFAASRTITISFDNTSVTTATTDSKGGFSDATFTVPESYRGSHIVTVTDYTNSASTGLIVLQSITVSSASAVVGATVKVSGTGFTAGMSITLTYDNVVVATSPASIITNSAGSFSATFSVPASFTRAHEIIASDGVYTASAVFTSLATISLNPTTGNVGAQIMVSGTGFGASISVSIDFDTTRMGTTSTDSTGNFTTSFNVPDSFNGTHTVMTSDGTYAAYASFITRASMSLTPATANVGAEIIIKGAGFVANKSVTIRFTNVPVKTTVTDAKGSFSDKLIVPQSIAGIYNVTASDGVNTDSFVFAVSASASISQTTGNVGTNLTASGSGFSGPVTIKYDTVVAAVTTAEANGLFSTTFTVPASIYGDHIITINDALNKIQIPFTMESMPPPVPAPLLPATGAKVKPQPSFGWQSVTDPSDVSYTLQIAADTDFSNMILQKQGLTKSEYTFTKTEKLSATKKEAPYYWRIKAIDGALNESAWSAPSSFYVSSFPDWARYTLIGFGALIVALFIFWLGRRTAPVY